MADPKLTAVTRALNKEYKGKLPEGLRCKVAAYGSFLSVRIEDPDGLLSVKLAREIMQRAGGLLQDACKLPVCTPMQPPTYHMDGVVCNWNLNH